MIVLRRPRLAFLALLAVLATGHATAQSACAPGMLLSNGVCRPTRDLYRWVPVSAGVPMPVGAVVGGWESDAPLVICRGASAGLHPGKVVGTTCNFGYGGAEVVVSSYEVLVGPPPHWVPARGGLVPPGSFVGGSEPARQLVICRAAYGGGLHPGKIVGATCNIGWGGSEITLDSYEVMVP